MPNNDRGGQQTISQKLLQELDWIQTMRRFLTSKAKEVRTELAAHLEANAEVG